jgi:hypothetical protein
MRILWSLQTDCEDGGNLWKLEKQGHFLILYTTEAQTSQGLVVRHGHLLAHRGMVFP